MVYRKALAAAIAFVMMVGLFAACSADNKGVDRELGQEERLVGDLLPGDVFKEFKWNGPFINGPYWQRVINEESKHWEAISNLPNPVNKLVIDDLKDAERAEVLIEMWGGHPWTTDKRVRFNGNEWISIPELDTIPDEHPESYCQFRYPVVSVPLEHIKEGENTVEFYSGPQVGGPYMTPENQFGQWAVYGFSLRVFYKESKPHTTGRILKPEKTVITDEDQFYNIQLDMKSVKGKIKTVDYIAFCEDFDYDGDGIYYEWQYNYYYGAMNHHCGTSRKEPYIAAWHVTWLPDQEKPIKIIARITDENGMCYMTPILDGITVERKSYEIKMYKPYGVPRSWQTRVSTPIQGCKIDIEDDLGKAMEARMILSTWSGTMCEAIGINRNKLVSNTGLAYDLGYSEIPVDVKLLRQGTNYPYTHSTTTEHGIEVNWPGIVLKVKYKK